MISTIYRHELISMFRTPFAWLLLGLCAALVAYQFLAQIEFYMSVADKLATMEQAPGVTQLVVVPTMGFCATLVMFLVPIVSMLSIAGERRAGTVALIASAPVSMWSFVIGKFLSLSTLFVSLWVIVATMVLTLLWGTQLDLGLCLGGLVALLGYTLAAVSIGLCVSALLSHPVAAGSVSLVTLLFLWFCDWVGGTNGEVNLFSHLAASRHFNRLASGLFDSFDVIYFVVIIIFGLAIAHWRLSNERYFG